MGQEIMISSETEGLETENLRAAVIGTGAIAQRLHMPAYRTSDLVELVAVCDVEEKKAATVAEEFEIDSYYTDYTEMLESGSVDVVSVCLPSGKLSVKLPDPTKLRQQHNYEVLVDPAYRLYVWLANDDRFEELAAMLEDGRSHYVPSLGLSEHLAELDYHGIEPVEVGPAEGSISVDSAVPNAIDRVIPETETRCQVEESPAFMTADSGGRTTTGFTSYAYNPDAGPLTVRDPETAVVSEKTVMFV